MQQSLETLNYSAKKTDNEYISFQMKDSSGVNVAEDSSETEVDTPPSTRAGRTNLVTDGATIE